MIYEPLILLHDAEVVIYVLVEVLRREFTPPIRPRRVYAAL